MAKVYLAGDILNKGAQMQRAQEAKEIVELGHEIYNPQDNKEINDKAALKDEPLAEKIVRHDTDAIKWADTVVIEPLPQACGTMVELGQIHGMRMMAENILCLMSQCESHEEFWDGAIDCCSEVLNQKVLPHFQDVRRVPGIMEKEDRRSLGINQYVYGVVLALTNGKGFYEWDEIKEELNK